VKSNNPFHIRIFIAAGLLALFLIVACNPNRDRWINRKWHTMTGHFNIYFNGEQKLLDVTTTLETGHRNDFNKILDVFPYGNEQSAKGVTNILDDALKKFSGAIQLHTVGTYTDDAYFSLGKCYFFKRDYYAAIESFQYVNGRFPQMKNISTCWIAKSYMGLNKISESEAIMGILLAQKNIHHNDITEIYATAADANIRLEKYKPAIENLKKVLADGKTTKNQRIRFNYILGQLNLIDGNKAAASFYFNKVLNLIPPYDFAFNANISLTRIYDPKDKKSANKVRKSLKAMTRDDKNIDYLDQIYYELGRLELSQKNFPPAVTDFKTSVAKSTKNPVQKSKSYLELAKLYFETKDYKNAKAYYDSTAQTIDKSDKNYDNIKATKTVLSDLINNLLAYETEDSLQKLSLLSRDELERKIDLWMAYDKKQKELAAKDAKKRKSIEASLAANQDLGGGTNINNFLPDGNTSWYFYNPTLVASGAADFFSARKWGQRANEDYWRIAAKEKPRNTNDTITSITDKPAAGRTDSLANNSKTDGDSAEPDGKEVKAEEKSEKVTGMPEKDAWVRNVPFSAAAKRQSNLRMMEALHNMGLIYYTKLKNPVEGAKYFEELEKRFPSNEYEPEVYYQLHKIYIDLKDNYKAEYYKNELIKNYPENPYALLVQGKAAKTVENDANKKLVTFYENAYLQYTLGNYAEVKRLKAEADKTFPGNSLRPKFEYLNALALGQTDSVGVFKNALRSIVKEFSGSDVAERADETLKILDKEEQRVAVFGGDSTLNDLRVELDPGVPHCYVFALKNDKSDFNNFVEKITVYNDQYAQFDNLRANAIMSNEGYQVLLVRQFPNYAKAIEYYRGIKANNVPEKRFEVKDPYVDFVISMSNLTTILKDKKIAKYQALFLKQLAKEKEAK